jgi:hypothetical protein
MKIDQPGNRLGIAHILNSEEDQQPDTTVDAPIKTGIASTRDSFVTASSDKSFLSTANSNYGVASGFKTDAGQSDPVHVEPGNAWNGLGQQISPEFLHGLNRLSFFDGKRLNAADFSQEQQYQMPSIHRNNLFTAPVQSALDAFRANAVFERLATLTGKTTDELSALFGKYELDAGRLPNPPDEKVSAFLADPAFTSLTKQDLLQALYGS